MLLYYMNPTYDTCMCSKRCTYKVYCTEMKTLINVSLYYYYCLYSPCTMYSCYVMQNHNNCTFNFRMLLLLSLTNLLLICQYVLVY